MLPCFLSVLNLSIFLFFHFISEQKALQNMATTPQTPKRKSSLDVQNLVSPTKKEVLSGYVLYVSPMLNRGQFSQYTVQLQTHPEFTQKMIAFNSKAHATLVASVESASQIKMEVRCNNENGNRYLQIEL